VTLGIDEYRLLKLQELRELKEEEQRQEAIRHSQMDVFATLGYQPSERQREFHDATEQDVLYGGAAGGGKGGRCPDRAAPSYDPDMETKVLTPKGFKLIGDVQIGDAVCNPDGTTAKVIRITDNGPKQFYKVKLADGSSVEADEDHLWAFSISGARKRRKQDRPDIPEGLRPEDEWNLRVQSRCRIVNTVELQGLVLRAAGEKAAGLRPHYVQLPLTNPVAMTGVKGRWPVFSPYILGALVGDGSFTQDSVTISGEDAGIFDRIQVELPEHLCLRRNPSADCPTYRITRRDGGETAKALLTRDGLMGLYSWEKFIPKRLKTAPVADRFAFVQGLMDTDGYMDDRGHVEYVSVSERLASEMQEMLRSLGYRATMTTKTPTYEYQGEKKEGRLAYRLYIQGRHLDRLFHLARKRERVAQFNGGDVEPWHRVVSVEPSGVDNSRCITVDNLNHLYVTDDYIVTHNSYAIVMEAFKSAVRYPGIRILIMRRTFDELAESIFPVLAKHRYGMKLGARWNGTEKELRFSNGSILRCRYLESAADASRRQGGQYQLLLVDEATLMPPGAVDMIKFERLRSDGDGPNSVPVIGTRMTCNPGGPSHGAIKTRYIKPTNYGRDVFTDDNGITVRFIPAKATDNPHLNDAYFRNLDAIPDPDRRAAMRDGDWDRFAGMLFSEFSRDRHTLEPITLPAEWRRYEGVDWGYAAPWATVFGAEDPDGRIWIWRELYESGVGEAEQARRILAAEDGIRPAARFADDAMWATLGDAKPIAQVYAEQGCLLEKAGKGPGSRIAGWQRIHSFLEDGPACLLHRDMGWSQCPRLHIFTTCVNLLRELVDLPYATRGNVEDADSNASDHAADALRYLLLNVGNAPRFHFPTQSQEGAHLLDPFAESPIPTSRVEVPNIGGFPIMTGSTPWDW
jgi:hypothetical protein